MTAPARSPRAFPWGPVLLLLAAAGAVFALSLGTRDLWPPDEPRYALVAREMLEDGSWFLPHVNGRPYPDKPPLLFWLIALASRLTGGVNQVSAVLPSLVSALLVLLGAARLAFVLPGRNTRGAPLLAAGLLAVSWRFAMQATVGQIDMLLVAGTTWAFLLLVLGAGLDPGGRPRPRLAVLAWGAMGLAILAKGPVGLILPLGGLVLGLLLAGERVPWRRLFPPAGIALLVAVLAAWLVPASLEALRGGNRSWLFDLLFRQTAVRYVASWHHFRPPWYLFVVPLYDFQPLVLFALPGILALPRAFRAVRRAGAADPDRRAFRAVLLLAGAVLFVLVFFSIPRGKRAVYILPAMPLLAALAGIDLDRRLAGRAPLRPLRLAAGAAALLFGGLAIALFAVVPGELAARGIDLDPRLFAGTLALAAALLLAAALARKPAPWLAAALLAGLATWGVGYRTVLPALDARNSAGAFVAAAREKLRPGAPGGMVDFRARFGFHAGRLVEALPSDHPAMDRLARRLAGDEPFWVIVRERHLPALLRRIPPDRKPVEVLRRPVGNAVFVVLANRAALREPPAGRGDDREEEP